MTDAPEPAAPTAPAARSPRWVKIVLLVSLTLNLGMAGLLAGAAFRPGHGEGADAALAPVGLRLFGAALPETAREGLRRDLGERRAEMIAARRALRAELGALLAALRAEPFDPAEAARALGAQREIAAAQIVLGQEALLARLAAMSPDERRRFADRIEAELRHSSRGRDRSRD
jgi:uncharacterized membrane protein